MVPARGLQLQPRAARSPQQVRGGVGIFSGRTPYVWLSNQYTGTGLEFTQACCHVQRHQSHSVRGRSAQPAAQRRRGGAERGQPARPGLQIPAGAALEPGIRPARSPAGRRPAEFLQTKTLQDVFYQNLNYAESGQTRPDGRPVMTRVNHDLQQRVFPDQHRSGRSVDREREGRTPDAQRPVRQRVVSLRPIEHRERRRQQHGIFQLAVPVHARQFQPACARDFRPRRASPRQCDGVVSAAASAPARP